MRGHVGRNNYNSLQAKFERRYARGQSIVVSFTWQKLLDYGGTSPQDQYHWQNNYGPGDANRKLYLSLSHVWQLPFHANGAAGQAVNGWYFNGLAFIGSGVPFTPTLSNTASYNVPGVTLRPDRIRNGALDNPTRNRWFDPTAFAAPALYTYGDSGRNIPDWSEHGEL